MRADALWPPGRSANTRASTIFRAFGETSGPSGKTNLVLRLRLRSLRGLNWNGRPKDAMLRRCTSRIRSGRSVLTAPRAGRPAGAPPSPPAPLQEPHTSPPPVADASVDRRSLTPPPFGRLTPGYHYPLVQPIPERAWQHLRIPTFRFRFRFRVRSAIAARTNTSMAAFFK